MVLEIAQTLQQGVAAHQAGNLQDAERLYRAVLQVHPKHTDANHNLGVLSLSVNRGDEALSLLKVALETSPATEQFWFSYIEALIIQKQYEHALHVLQQAKKRGVNGKTLKVLDTRIANENSQGVGGVSMPSKAHVNYMLNQYYDGRMEEAEMLAFSMTQEYPKYAHGWKMLGTILPQVGKYSEALKANQTALALSPKDAEIHYNLGIALQELVRLDEAEESYKQATKLKPEFPQACWNMHSLQKTVEDAEYWIDQCLMADKKHVQAKLTKAALRFYQGDSSAYDSLVQSEFAQHPFIRTFAWVFGLPNLPGLHFNQWDFFDAIIEKSVPSRPFYEFGVWRASSFRYLIQTFKKGYGFDTFIGLTEDWEVGSHLEKKGSYSNAGNIPQVEGGEFIVGAFEDTLPGFFSESRPVASVMNFDADLYSSTICALNHSKPVMDKDTVLIFDQFIINESWEQDEFKALNEFCSANDLSYEVVAISFFTKQVAVKLIGL